MTTHMLDIQIPIDETPDPMSLKAIGERRVRTRQATEHAKQVLETIARDPEAKYEEADLFAAFQVCAYQASKRMRGPAAKQQQVREQWAAGWKMLRDNIIERNLGLVYTMITRFHARDLDWDEQRSEALYALIRAVDGYNPWSGFRFSTYACNAITRALIHLSKKTTRYRMRFPLEHESWRERPVRVDEWSELYADRVRRALDENLGELTDREAAVLGWRFPMRGGRSLTLGEIGAAIGLSKERARQIQEQALSKLREVLEADPALQ